MVQLYKRMDFESINSCFQDEKNTPRRDLGMEIEQVIHSFQAVLGELLSTFLLYVQKYLSLVLSIVL